MSDSKIDGDEKIKSESSDEDTFKSNLSGSSPFTSVKLNMAVNIKAPQFSTENPKLWFAQVEAQFATYQVATDRAKFDLVIPLLETRIAAEVQDTIINPPANTPYSDLKAALIKCFTRSEEARITQLLDRERLGDRTPSQHLRHLRTLVPGIDDAIIKARWFSHMPNEFQVCFEAISDSTLDKLAESADRMVERISLKPQVAAATANQPSTAEPGEIAALRREIAQLANQVNNLTVKRGRSRSRSRSRVSKKFDLCWYHYKHGKNARSCIPGCKWQGNLNENQ
ncbi:uncharacterized protein LOC130670442 [Microplitis mediator]|uniref:uncharacterized protein LOC130670442 n=1 Tax=Microplitis mediator TaxID=375433 RepID=UPI002553F051|nr:uncharacterized protein LOC130670442 [Microplitis mediator]